MNFKLLFTIISTIILISLISVREDSFKRSYLLSNTDIFLQTQTSSFKRRYLPSNACIFKIEYTPFTAYHPPHQPSLIIPGTQTGLCWNTCRYRFKFLTSLSKSNSINSQQELNWPINLCLPLKHSILSVKSQNIYFTQMVAFGQKR